MTTTQKAPINGRTEKQPTLVGRYFHSFTMKEDGCQLVQWQGEVIAQITPEVYLVQLFDWIHGQESNQALCPLADMLDWSFYSTSEDMNFRYEQNLASRTDRHLGHTKEAV